jgi:Carboxypeptidase regulatory-like domain
MFLFKKPGWCSGRGVGARMLGLVLAFLSCSPCAAQAVYGSIVGRVSDPSGAVIKGASVSAEDSGTNERRISVTNSDDRYRPVTLIPGTYRLMLRLPDSASGDQRVSRRRVSCGPRTCFTSGSSSSDVLVVAEAPLEEGEKLLHRSKPLAFARVDFFHAPLELTADRLGFLSEAKDEGSFHNG